MELKYAIKKRNPDICILNETHVTEQCDISDLTIKNYHVIHCNSFSKHTGGVSFYIRKSIKYSNVSVYEQHVAWFLSIEISIYNIPTVIAGIYLSANSEHKQIVLDLFKNWFETVSSNKSTVVCGDFNINMLSNSIHSQRLKNIFDDNGATMLTNSPTRIAENSTTMIDLCVSNVNKKYISCHVISDDQISDHLMLDIEIKGKAEQICVKNRKINVWHDYDSEKLCQNIESKLNNWDEIKLKSVDEKTNWLLTVLSESTKEFIREKEVKINDDFFDNEMEQMRIEKNRLYKLAQYANANDRDKDKRWYEYRLYKNNFKDLLQQKNYESNQNKLNQAKGDTKRTWKVLNSILNKENNEILMIKDGDNLYEDDETIVEKFNEFFVDSIVQINQEIPHIDFEHSTMSTTSITTQFKFHGVTISEIKNCCRELKNNTDEYFMNARALLDSMNVIAQHIADIINDSLSSGVFPYALKKSTIIPIQKKSGTILINEHRPINMLPVFEKLIEKLTYSQLIEYVNKNQLLADHQSGFRRKHSCETAINDVLYEWKDALDKSKIIIAVFLDFRRAFETIEPQIMLNKLFHIGIRDTELEFFKSYLSDRRQVVKLGEFISSEINNHLGVPQGSILGPLLFILYVNDLGDCLQNCKIKMFADDTLIYAIEDLLENATKYINDDLTRLYDVICQNKLKLNVDKTKVMIISNKQIDKNNVNIFIDNCRLEIENEIKYLGVILDDKLKFDKNTDYLCKKIGKKTNVISRLRNELSTEQKTMIYKTILETHFTYCASILFLCTNDDIDRLQVLQNKCMRNILKKDRFTSTEALTEAMKTLSVNQIITYRTLIFIYNIRNHWAPKYLSNRIIYRNEEHNLNLRNGNQMSVVNVTKTCSQNSLFYKGIKLFNDLPVEIREENSYNKFVQKLKIYVRNNY